MFTRLKSKTGKSEFRSVIRSIFATKSKTSPPTSPRSSLKKSSSFGRRLRARICSFRKRENSTDELKDHIGNTYNSFLSPLREDTHEEDLNLTSILKGPNVSKSSHFHHRLRFEDELEKTSTASEQDRAYYERLKRELLDRNKDIVKKNPLKRKASCVSTIEKQREKVIKTTEEDGGGLSPETNIFYGFPAQPKDPFVLNVTYSYDDGDTDSNSDEHKKKPLRGKFPSKFSAKKRFDPIAKPETCSVAALSKNELNRMSWCST